MMGKAIWMILVVWVCSVLTGPRAVASADEKDAINKFYRNVVQTIKKPVHLKELVALVENNPAIAKRCLEVCGRKADGPGQQAAGLKVVQEALRTAILLGDKSCKCPADYVRQVVEASERQTEEDDRIFCLERLTAMCPRAGEVYGLLGDLYLQQRRCGMAVSAYQTSVELTADQDSRELLQEAKDCKDDYVARRPIRYAELKELLGRERTMGLQRVTVRKAQIGSSIQRQVLFDEWSDKIKDPFLPDLKVIGEGLREELPRNPDVRLLIEGHSDKRGDSDRNMKISKDRAESIKNYLVQNYGINQAQLATEGYGPTRPYTPEENEAGYALNRRVEFKKLQ